MWKYVIAFVVVQLHFGIFFTFGHQLDIREYTCVDGIKIDYGGKAIKF
jgi:hypothetical protein